MKAMSRESSDGGIAHGNSNGRSTRYCRLRNMWSLGDQLLHPDGPDIFFKELWDDVKTELCKVALVGEYWIDELSETGDIYMDIGTDQHMARIVEKFDGRWFGGKQIKAESISEDIWAGILPQCLIHGRYCLMYRFSPTYIAECTIIFILISVGRGFFAARLNLGMSMEEDDWEPAVGEHPTWSMEEIESHPLFMTDTSKDVSNVHIDALQSVLYGDETPLSVCQNLKDQGNEALRLGLVNDAGICYTRALASGCKDKELLSQVYSNLALVYLKQGKFPECVNECYRAIGENPSNVKAFYRGATASLKLELFSQGLYFATGGLAVEKDNMDLNTVLVELEEKRRQQIAAKEKAASVSQAEAKPRPKYRWRD